MSRHDGQSTRLRHRPSRAVPAFLVGLVLLAAGVALVWLTIARLVNGTWSTLLQVPRDWLTSLTWNSASVWGIGIAAVVVGVILLLCALVPGGFSALTVRDVGTGSGKEPVPVQETVLTRSAVARLAKAACGQIDGVGAVSATASTTKVHVGVQTPLHDAGDLRTRVIDAVRDRLETAGLDPVPRISATVHSKG